jgi:hypothetical protein
VRINIDAALQQEEFDRDGKPHWKGRLDAIYLPGKADAPAIEAERIEHGLKWSPVKVFARIIPRGIGKSSNWRMFVSYLTRAGEEIPPDGVPFTARTRAATRRCSMTCDSCSRAPESVSRTSGRQRASRRECDRKSPSTLHPSSLIAGAIARSA